MKNSTKEKRRVSGYAGHSLILAAIGTALIVVSVIACLIAKANPKAVTKYFTPFSRVFGGIWGKAASVFPFALGEILLYAVIIAAVVTLILLIFKWRKSGGKQAVFRYVAIVWLVAGCHAAFFVFSWGLNYFGDSLSNQLNFDTGIYPPNELIETTRYYLGLVNDRAENVGRRETDGAVDVSDTEAIFASACEMYRAQDTFDWNGAIINPPKKVMSWYLLSCMNIAGIHDPYTAECIVNTDSPPASLPFTACHELAHAMGYAAENEANYIGIVLCRDCDDALLSYSGRYTGFIYCYNALCKVNREVAHEIWNELKPEVIADVIAANRNIEKYENKVTAKVSNVVNDTYLKVMDQSGIQSYGEVVDLLIAEYVGGKA